MTALVLLAGLTGVGLVVFWTWGIVGGGVSRAPEPWPGFRDHELSFAPVDIVLGLVLIGCAGLAWVHHPAAGGLARTCGGALLFLGGLDFVYLARTWPLRGPPMRVRTAIAATAATGIGAALCAVAP